MERFGVGQVSTTRLEMVAAEMRPQSSDDDRFYVTTLPAAQKNQNGEIQHILTHTHTQKCLKFGPLLSTNQRAVYKNDTWHHDVCVCECVG